MQNSERHFSPAEVARRLGLSVKALRVYETRGLVRPRRTAAGWRVYGSQDIGRLHQILVLKSLGLSLAQVGQFIDGEMGRLDSVLVLQQSALKKRRTEIDRALERLNRARAHLAGGTHPSPEDLIELIKETTMTEPLTPDEYRAAFEPIWRKHFTKDDLATLAANAPFDQQAVTGAWADIFTEARALMAAQDRASPRAKALLERWQALAGQFTGGDAALARKATDVWRDALADESLAQRLPVDAELWAFVGSIASVDGTAPSA